MRLKSVFINHYKNLRNFTLSFTGANFIDVFVGKNGSGKSNLFEAMIEIFRHLVEFNKDKSNIDFEYAVTYEIDGQDTTIEWREGKLNINGRDDRTSLGRTVLPDNVLIYYSGHNTTVAGLVQRYEEAFRKRIKGANLDDSRRFIGIGPEYKSLLLAVLLAQPNGNSAREFVKRNLGISRLGIRKPGQSDLTDPVIKLVLERPDYAKGKTEFDIEFNDESDRYWKAEGITKDFLDRLSLCIERTPGNMSVSEGYFASDDRYILYIDIARLQKEFADFGAQDLFRQLDNLKTLGMLADIEVPFELANGVDATVAHFSDGQFQSVYIYAVVELFKDRNCLTLLDEPDAFLHPEWQFSFLKQVFEITDSASKKNHVLMSSHSASTITTVKDSLINLFEFDGANVVVVKVKKADVIKSLSAGLIAFSESEARLNIHHILKNTSGAVLFTEGITDEMILETAWSKLYPSTERKFEIQNAFSCGFLRNLVKDSSLYQNHPGRTFFSLFDFDEAYNDWNQLGQSVAMDPYRCLIKKNQLHESYALLLPVPTSGKMLHQVINPNTGG
ncbi:AAA family ATPase [Burkholderia cepacia]|uniref:AAA family ATPase n=1 Tax=Burkholderia cepacia TaxID=292 RepID=UPI001ABB4163|nr:AAA family ATPase [Burkholderia cepacia]